MIKIVFTLLISFTLNAEVNTTSKVGITEHLGTYVPMDMTFINHKGQNKSIKELADGLPLVMTFNYHRCASICSPQLAGLATAINSIDLVPGKDYNIATFSIDPTDSFEFAAKKQKAFSDIIQKYPSIVNAWNFVVNPDEKFVQELTKKVGFGYQKAIKDGRVDYQHPAALIIIASDGKITRYLNGVEYLPFDLKLALLESSEGKTGPTIARSLLYCFAYDPASRKYVFQIEKIFAIILTLLLIVFFIFLIKSRRK